MTQISRFIGEVVPVAQRVTGGGFADYAFVSLHCLRMYLDTSYRMTIDLLKEMPQITGEIGRAEADLPAPSTLCKAFDRISMSVCRVLLRQSAFTNRRFVSPQNRRAILGRSYTILPNTARSTRRSTNGPLRAVTTASELATAFRN